MSKIIKQEHRALICILYLLVTALTIFPTNSKASDSEIIKGIHEIILPNNEFAFLMTDMAQPHPANSRIKEFAIAQYHENGKLIQRGSAIINQNRVIVGWRQQQEPRSGTDSFPVDEFKGLVDVPENRRVAIEVHEKNRCAPVICAPWNNADLFSTQTSDDWRLLGEFNAGKLNQIDIYVKKSSINRSPNTVKAAFILKYHESLTANITSEVSEEQINCNDLSGKQFHHAAFDYTGKTVFNVSDDSPASKSSPNNITTGYRTEICKSANNQ